MRKTKSAWLAGILSLLTLSLYGWMCLTGAGEEIHKLESSGMEPGIKRWPLLLCLLLVILLIPADILLRIVFVTKPGFLQPEILASIGFFWLASSVLTGRLQAKINDLPAPPASASPVESPGPLPVQDQPNYSSPQAANAPRSVSPQPVSMTGSSWQQGIATIAPTVVPVDESQPQTTPPAQTPRTVQPQVISPTQPKQ